MKKIILGATALIAWGAMTSGSAVLAADGEWSQGSSGSSSSRTTRVSCGPNKFAIGVTVVRSPDNMGITAIGLVCGTPSWQVWNASGTRSQRQYSAEWMRTPGAWGGTFAEPRESRVLRSSDQRLEKFTCREGRGRPPAASADGFLVQILVKAKQSGDQTVITGLDLNCVSAANSEGNWERVQFAAAPEAARTNGGGRGAGGTACPRGLITALNIRHSEVGKENALLWQKARLAPNQIQAKCSEPPKYQGGSQRPPGGMAGTGGDDKLSFARDLYPVITTQCSGCHGGNRLYPQRRQSNAAACGVNAEPAIPFDTSMSPATMLNRLTCLKASSRDGAYTRALGKIYVVPGDYNNSGLHWKAQASPAFSAATRSLIQTWIAQGANP